MGRPATAAELAELDGPTPVKKSRPATAEELKELNGPPEPSLWDKAKPELSAAVDTFAGNAKAAADTASLGLLPRALAAYDSVGETMSGHGGLTGNYNKALTDRQADSRKTAAEHPSASIVGSFLTPPVGKALSAGQRLVSAGATGAASGYLQAPHDNPEAQLVGGIESGLSGVAMQGFNEHSGPLAARFGGKLRRESGERALNVAGGGKAQIGDRLKKMGIGPEDQAEAGNRMIDEGLIPWGLSPSRSPVDVVHERAGNLRESSGRAIGDEINAADASGAEFMPEQAQVDMVTNMKSRTPGQRNNATKANKFVSEVGEVNPNGQFAINSFKLANEQKSDAWKNANFKDDAPMEADQYRRAVTGLRNSIRDQVGKATGPASADRLSAANERFGVAADAHKLAENAISRGNQGQQFGLPAAVAMAIGSGLGVDSATGSHAAGGTTAALIAAALLKSRGPAFATRAGRAGSDVAGGVSRMSQNPAASGAAGSALLRYFAGLTDEEKKAELEKLGQ